MKILVTGATGYIGGAVAKALLAGGHEVVGLARGEASQRDLAMAVSRMIGARDRTENFTMPQMRGFGWAEQIGLSLTKVMPRALVLKLQSGWTPPSTAATGLSLCVNKRLSSKKTRQLLNWKPSRTDFLKDLEFGSYAV